MNKKIIVVGVAFLLLVGFWGASQYYKAQQQAEAEVFTKKNIELLERSHSPRKGADAAKVTIVEFFDPACETCKAFHPFVMRLMNENPGRIQVVMRYAPFHHGSDYVVALMDAAKVQGKFWETLEAAYASQDIWASHSNPQPKKLWMQLSNVGLDFTKAQQDMQSEQVINNINQDIADLKEMKVDKTPSFFVNGKPLVDFGYGQLRALVEEEIRLVY